MKHHRKRTIAGVELVLIPVADYIDLLECKQQLAVRTVDHEQLLSPRRSRIERNPEVAIFLTSNFGLKRMPDLLKECRKKFGAARTPSRQAAYRYWQKVRSEAKEKR